MKLQFDDFGNLFPYKIITISLDDFEENFVFNEHRKQLFESYLQIIIDLKAIGIEHFTHWINGSYTTLKFAPNDIDIVTLIDYRLYNTYEKELLDLKKRYVGTLDFYFLIDYPQTHKNINRTQFDKTEWRFLFSTDRRKKSKGFISINF